MSAATSPVSSDAGLHECMRWYGDGDPVALNDILQCGATGVVTALHDIPAGEVWPEEAVKSRAAQIAAAGLRWDVVESIPVHDEIKRGAPGAPRRLEAWIESMRSVAAAGVRTICYNFMPVLDWTRTDLDHPLASGATALRFDATAFAAFDLHILKRPGAEADYTEDRFAKAQAYAEALDEAGAAKLTHSVIAGLPGGMSGSHDLDGLREAIALYQGVDRNALLANIVAFQSAVAPEAERLGVRLAIHPDDPPRPLLGLPRAVSTPQDFAAMFSGAPSPANGLTWCMGSLSAGAPGDAIAVGSQHLERVYFAHFRIVGSDPTDPESFQEAAHLEGNESLIDAVAILLLEQKRRGETIPMRPDHGWRMLDDLRREANPGYGVLGRMRGLAELRGAAQTLLRLGLGAPAVADMINGGRPNV